MGGYSAANSEPAIANRRSDDCDNLCVAGNSLRQAFERIDPAGGKLRTREPRHRLAECDEGCAPFPR